MTRLHDKQTKTAAVNRRGFRSPSIAGMLIAAFIVAGCSAPASKPKVATDDRPVVDHPTAPLPPKLDPGNVQRHDAEAMQRALTPLDQIIATLPTPDFLQTETPVESAEDDTADENEVGSAETEVGQARTNEPPRQAQRAFVKARQLLRERRIYDALRELRAADRVAPNQPSILRLLGRIYADTGNRVRGREYFQRVIRLEPTDRATLFRLGELAIRDGDDDRAMVILAHLADMSAGEEANEPAFLPLAHYYLGTSMDRRRYDRVAIEQLHRYLLLDERTRRSQSIASVRLRLLARDKGETFMTLGDLYLRLGEVGEALSAYRAAGDAGVGDVQDLLRRLIYVNLRLDRPADAAAVMIDRLANDPNAVPDSDELALIRFVVEQHADSRQRIASHLRSVYESTGGSTRLAIAVADVMPEPDAVNFLRDHLRHDPTARGVLASLLDRHVPDVETVDDAAMFEAVRSVAIALKANDRYVDLFVPQLFAKVGGAPTIVSLFERLPIATDTDPYVRLIHARALLVGGADDRAEAELQELVDADPDFVAARESLATVLIAGDRHAAALAVIEPVVDAKRPRTVQLQVAALLQLGRTADAVDSIDRALLHEPANTELILLKSRVQIENGNPEDAATTLSSALRIRPREEQLYEALFYLYQGELADKVDARDKSLDVAQRMYEALPDSRAARRIRGYTLIYYEGKFDDGLRMLEAVYKEEPTDPGSLMTLAAAYHVTDQVPRKRKLLEDHLDRLPDDPDERYLFAGLCMRLNEQAISERVLEEVLKDHPNHPASNNDLGYTWADRGVNLERALAMVSIAVKAEPKNGSYLDSLGWVYYKLGEFDKAIQHLTRAHELMPDPIVLDHLGDAQYRAGDTDDAMRTWERALILSNDPKHLLLVEPELRGNLRAKIDAMRLERVPNVAPLGRIEEAGNTPEEAATNVR